MCTWTKEQHSEAQGHAPTPLGTPPPGNLQLHLGPWAAHCLPQGPASQGAEPSPGPLALSGRPACLSVCPLQVLTLQTADRREQAVQSTRLITPICSSGPSVTKSAPGVPTPRPSPHGHASIQGCLPDTASLRPVASPPLSRGPSLCLLECLSVVLLLFLVDVIMGVHSSRATLACLPHFAPTVSLGRKLRRRTPRHP